MHTLIKGTLSFDFIPHGHHHVIHILRLQMIISRYHLLPPPASHNLQNTCGKPCYEPHSVKPGGVSNTNHKMYSRHKINTSLATTGDCSIEWRPSVQATTRTLTPVTLANLNTAQGMLMLIRHPKPQLKGCHSKPQLKECHVFTLYLEPQLKRYHYDPQLKEYSSKFIFKVPSKALQTTHIQIT